MSKDPDLTREPLPAATREQGMVMVPREPDIQMMLAGSQAGAQTPIAAELIYKAMLAAAQPPAEKA